MLVCCLSDPGKSLEEAIKLAQQIEENAPLAVRLSRNVMLQSLQISDEKEQVKLSNQAIPMLAVTDDFKEGPKAFIEKRKPKWNGKKPQGSKL
jgi:enoyl-CoA hydratase/carnithine racemase